MRKGLPDTDMRRVTLLENGDYSVKRGVLCSHCGDHAVCGVSYYAREDMDEVKQCSVYKPVIAFRPPHIGFEDKFNTVRTGRAWINRVNAGTIVSLIDAKTREVFGEAKVVRVVAGKKKAIAMEHGINNHKFKFTRTTKGKAGEQLLVNLRKAYGGMIFDSNDYLTAIYLRRCDGD